MASTATTSLLLEKQANTENRGTWGEKVNVALDILDKAVAGTTAISTTGGTTTLTNVNYTADQAKAAVLSVTGALVSNATIVVPNVSKVYTVINGTSGAFTLTVKTASGSGKLITQGKAVKVYVDGSDGVSYLTPEVGTTSATTLGTMATQNASAVAITGGTVTGITDLAVADGGTGASSAGDARTNLGLGTIATQAASSVAITGGSITGITDLAVADGGTGASTAAGARDNLGISEGVNQTNYYHVEDYGAVGDATAGGTSGTNDRAAFQSAIDAAFAAGGGTVRFSKRHLIDGANLIIKPNVHLQGPVERPGLALPVGTESYDDFLGVLYVNSSYYIECRWSTALSNCYILRKGLTTPPVDQAAATAMIAAFAGTAVQITNHDVTLRDLLILGFEWAVINGGSTGALGAPSRIRMEYVCGDCTNGLKMLRVHDISHISYSEFWPFLTASQGFTDETAQRAGTAFYWGDDVDTTTGDGSYMWGCFAYAYRKGFHLVGALHVKLVGCCVDSQGALDETSIGFHIDDGSRACSLVNCEAYAQDVAVKIETGGTTTTVHNHTLIQGFKGNANETYSVQVVTGRATITGCAFYDSGAAASTGIYAESTAGALTIYGNEFSNCVTPLNIHATPLALSQIYGNTTNSTTNGLDEAMRLRSATAAASALEVINTADSTPTRVGRFRGSRATPANNDTIYTDWELNDAAGNTTVCFRQNVRITDTTNTSEDAQAFWSLMVGGTVTDKLLFSGTTLCPVLDDGLKLGTTALGWSDLHLATGGVINWANGEILLTGAADTLTFTGGVFTASSSTAATSAFKSFNDTDAAAVKVATWEGDRATPAASDEIYQSFVLSDSAGNQDEFARLTVRGTSVASGSETGLFRFSTMNGSGVLTDYVSLTAATLRPSANDICALGSITVGWSDLHLATGGVINWANGEILLTGAADALTFTGGVFTASSSTAGTASLRGLNTTDSASVQGLVVEGDRATMAANDEVYTSFKLSDSAGNQDEFARLTVRGSTVTSASEAANVRLSIMVAGALTEKLVMTSAALRPAANDGLSLGNTTEMFSDLFLATGGVINWNNGTYTATQSGADLALSGTVTACSGTATPAGGSTSARVTLGTTSGFGVYYGSGAPTVSAAQGSLYLRSDGSSTSTRMYVNTDGGTTWTAVTTAT